MTKLNRVFFKGFLLLLFFVAFFQF